MKAILIISILFSTLYSFSQPKFESATEQSWSGGICCSGGTKYRITISGSKDVIENIKINSVGLHGREYTAPQITKSIQPADSLSYLLIEFNYSYSHGMNEKIIDQLIEKPIKVEDGIFYTLHRVEAKLVIGEITELVPMAYP